jgi:signal recognition particle receptor subunit beta
MTSNIQPTLETIETRTNLHLEDQTDFKIVFSGPMGAGKTTAINALSEIATVSTEAYNSDQKQFVKESTTVAMDYGQFTLEDGQVIKLFGTPGQTRFAFMWEILCKGAMGLVLLLDASKENVEEELANFVGAFHSFSPNLPIVVGVGRHEQRYADSLDPLLEIVGKMGVVAPVMRVDVRKKEDVLMLMNTLLCLLEARSIGLENE